jgi:tRNA A-37 threonylcarbamoyl transferase component Bud32
VAGSAQGWELELPENDRFTIRRRLGAGGMGVVYEAFDRERDTLVAIKTLRHLDADHLYRFKNEFRALADVEHPNLIRLGELVCSEGRWFFTMELVEGLDFLSWVRPGASGTAFEDTVDSGSLSGDAAGEAKDDVAAGKLDEAKLREALPQLVSAIGALHAAGKVHRDIKPTNVLVTPRRRLVLLDFGVIADAHEDDPNTSGPPVVGTPAYMAPDQAVSRTATPEADWYSVGVMLYEALTGRLPFAGTPLQIMMNKQSVVPRPPRELVPTIPADLDALCVDLLRTDPQERPTQTQIAARLEGRVAEPERVTSVGSSFVGRREEMGALHDALEAARRGQPTVVCVRGESGVGKSALIKSFARAAHAERDDVVELVGRCYEREAVPFKAFDGVVDALGRHLAQVDQVAAAMLLPDDAPLLARLFPTLRHVPAMGHAIEPKLADPVEVRRRAFVALRNLLARMASQKAVVIMIDDFQWSDADSLALLAELLHPDEAPSVLLVATIRSDADVDRAFEKRIAALCARRVALRRIDVEPLPAADAEILARKLALRVGLGVAIDASAIVREAAGHPLFIHELVNHAGLSGANATAAGPRRVLKLEEALGSRIEALEPAGRRVLEAVAVAGAPVLRSALALTLEQSTSPAELQRWLGSLHTLHLLRTTGSRATDVIECYHDRVREAVLRRLDAGAQRALHGALAGALESVGVAAKEPHLMVRHLEAAGDIAHAAAFAERGAARAADNLAFDRAAELYATAIRLGAHAKEEKSRLQMLLGQALVNAGRGAEAAEAYLGARDGALAATRLECQRRAAEQLLFSGQIDRGLEVLASVLADIGQRIPATPRRALADVLWLRLRLKMRGYGWKRRDASEIAPTDLIRVDTFRTVGLGLSTVDNIRGAAFQSRALMGALDLGEEERIGQALCVQANYLASQGYKNYPVTEKLLGEADRIAQATKSPFLAAWVQAVTGTANYLIGNYAVAGANIPAGLKRFEEETIGSIWELNNARLFWLLTLRQTGAYAKLGRLLDEWLRDAARRGDQYAETTFTRAGVLVLIMRDGIDAARATFLSRRWSPPEGAYHLQHWYELRAWVDFELAGGSSDEGKKLIDENLRRLDRSLLLRVEVVRAETLWMRARLALASGKAEAAGPLAKRLMKEGTEYARVWGLLVSAAVLHRLRAKDAAAAELARAIEAGDAQGMRMCAAAARLRLSELGVGETDREGALAALRTEGVRSVEQLLGVLAPGF